MCCSPICHPNLLLIVILQALFISIPFVRSTEGRHYMQRVTNNVRSWGAIVCLTILRYDPGFSMTRSRERTLSAAAKRSIMFDCVYNDEIVAFRRFKTPTNNTRWIFFANHISYMNRMVTFWGFHFSVVIIGRFQEYMHGEYEGKLRMLNVKVKKELHWFHASLLHSSSPTQGLTYNTNCETTSSASNRHFQFISHGASQIAQHWLLPVRFVSFLPSDSWYVSISFELRTVRLHTVLYPSLLKTYIDTSA